MLNAKPLMTAAVLGTLGLGLAACHAHGPERVGASEPTLTYTFDGSERELEQARFYAEEECRERYGRDADLEETYRDGDRYVAVFECD